MDFREALKPEIAPKIPMIKPIAMTHLPKLNLSEIQRANNMETTRGVTTDNPNWVIQTMLFTKEYFEFKTLTFI